MCSFYAHAQADSVQVWNKWCDRRDTMVLFTAANNVISVYSPTLKPSQLKIKSLDRSLRVGTPEVKGDTLEAMAMPFPEKGKNMRLAVMNSKTNHIIKTINFTSDNVPAIAAKVGNITAPEASKKEVLLQKAIVAYFPKSLYSYPYQVKQYTFHIHTDSVKADISMKNNLITRSMLLTIKNAPVGTVVEFSDIVATCPDCIDKPLENIKLKIK